MTELLTGHRHHVGHVRRPSGEPPPLPKELNRPAILWLAGFAGWAAIWAWVMLSDDPAIWITRRDLDAMRPIVDNRAGWLDSVFVWTNDISTPWLTVLVGWITILGGLLAKRLRHVVLFVASVSFSAVVVTWVALLIQRPRPLGFERLGEWEGFAQPSRSSTLLATMLVAGGLTLIPSGTARRAWFGLSAAIVGFVGFAQIYVAVDHPSDVFAGATVGVAVALVFFLVGAPEKVFPIAYGTGNTAHLDVTGLRGDAIRLAMARQLGVFVDELIPVGLAGSAGSTPLRITQATGPDLFAKLYAKSHLRSDRSYKLWRTLLYGRLEDEQRFTSVRRLIQHEDYMLRVMQEAGVDTMAPVGIIEITPDREYLLVGEFIDEGVEISQSEVTVEHIDLALETISSMWKAGIAHRDIKPANIMIQGDRVRLIDVAFGQIRPSPWRQAVDLANMMLVLALRSTPETVYERAQQYFADDEIAEAFAASRGVTLPSALRGQVKRDGTNLLERFRELAPAHQPIAIQRWSLRRLGLTVWVVIVVLLLGALLLGNLNEIGLRP